MSVETDFVGNAAADSAGEVIEDAPRPASSEGCPSPLGWAEVLESVRAESTAWSIDVEGAVLHGRTLGRGRPLYFLNGISGNWELFCLLAWLLRDDFRCVLFDYRTHEASGAADSARLSTKRLADDFLAVADGQHDQAFSLFAAPFGSLIALSAMAEHPTRIERAVLLGGFAQRRLSRFERFLCGAGRFLPGTAAQVPLRGTLQTASHQRAFPPFDASRWGFFAQNTGQTPIRDLAERAALMDETDLRGCLSRIEQPVLLIRTEHEGAISSAGQDELERSLPRASVEHMPLAGQLAYLTHPHRVAKAVRSFLIDAAAEGRPACEAVGLDNSCCADHKDESL
ncbi:MAG TPA: alpha/beta fold hydrolase [Planctomycetaceae bacterium]|jgi:pimeloyl-ACP methyl ester carboxylesterase|nr:alpha/beta fold hydrolase [Planctomycetaceae bacterium]